MSRRVTAKDGEELIAMLRQEKRDDIATARRLAGEGKSLFEISQAVRRTKEWLREYAGLGPR